MITTSRPCSCAAASEAMFDWATSSAPDITAEVIAGDTVVIEEHGPRALTKTPLKLYWKEA